MMKYFYPVFQFIFMIAAAPLAAGIIAKIKNNLRMRQGQSIFQPYKNLLKLTKKENIIPKDASWIFRFTPFMVFATSTTAAAMLPLTYIGSASGKIGDLIAIIFILGLGRFFLALAGLDAGSSFGGMGSSREMFISSFVEPAACLAIFALYMGHGSAFSITRLLIAMALLIIILAETSRLPFDNQETHLELTMIHEAMLLDYSGSSLALLELSAQIKQLFWISLLSGIIFSLSFQFFYAGLFLLLILIAFIEVGTAKYRLFKAPDLIIFSVILSLLAVVSAFLGV